MKKLSNAIPQVKQRLSIVFITLLFISFKLFALEDTRYWQRIGPEGGQVRHFITQQNHPEVVYASNGVGVYYKSLNGGKSWVVLPPINDPVKYIPYGLITGLAVDAVNPHILYTHSSEGLLKSSDNALHWQQLGGNLAINAASFFPLNNPVSQFLTVLTETGEPFEYGIAISQDSGQQWLLTDQVVSLLSEEKNEIKIIARDNKQPETLYGVVFWAGDFTPPSPFENNLYRSVDAGISWVNITVPAKKYSGGFSISLESSQKLYATFDGIAMVSINGGDSWEPVGNVTEGSVSFNITKVYLDPVNLDVLYANVVAVNYEDRVTYASRIAKSNDAGDTWQLINISPYIPGSDIAINALNNQKLLMTSGQGRGILRSENGGQDWVLSNTGLNFVGDHFSVAKNDQAVMYTIDKYNNYYKSIDGGLSWKILMTKKPVSGTCNQFLINPVQNQEIICQSYEGLYVSKDAGEHWEILIDERNAQAMYTTDGTIFVLVAGEINRSLDAGQTWKKIARITLALDKPRVPFIQQEVSSKSLPFPSEISEIDADNNFDTLPIADPLNANILYAFASEAIFKSIDRGDSWQVIFQPETVVSGEWKLLISPDNPDFLLFFRGTNSILLSNDGGKSWEKALESLITTSETTPEIAFDPNHEEGLFRVVGDSIFYSADKGLTWDLVNKGLVGETQVLLHTAGSSVFVSAGTGIFKLSEKADFSTLSDCLFQWAEKKYPKLFIPGTSGSQQWGGYVYRYYQQSDTYLGFFYEQEVHVKQAKLSGSIDVAGTVSDYQGLTGCS